MRRGVSGDIGVELGLNLQNQDPSFLCNQKRKSSSAVDVDDDDGYKTSMMRSIYDGVHSSAPLNSTVPIGFVKGCYSYPSAHTFFKPSGSGEMGTTTTTTRGLAFTEAQWKELERQAMIYKYMVASLPVPPDLLYSSFPIALSYPSTCTPTSYFVGKYGNGLNMRWVGNSKDAEPWRCKRTDGKKWRCARDVAPNQKYCERHMHRGRPCSRKPVELHHHSLSDFTTKIKNPNPKTKKTPLNVSNVQPVVSSLPSASLSKASTFDHPIVSSSIPFQDSRSLAWAEEQQHWQQLMQTNLNPSVYQQQFEGVPLNLNDNYGYNPKSEIGLLERPLIDAWSMGLSEHKDNYDSNNGFDENMCEIHMGLGVMDSPGGPLAEVLRPGSVAPTGLGSNPDVDEVEFVTPPATAVSSPSGVLQKPHGSFSDSSGSSTPTYHNSKAKSDMMPFHWLS